MRHVKSVFEVLGFFGFVFLGFFLFVCFWLFWFCFCFLFYKNNDYLSNPEKKSSGKISILQGMLITFFVTYMNTYMKSRKDYFELLRSYCAKTLRTYSISTQQYLHNKSKGDDVAVSVRHQAETPISLP